MKFSLPRNSTCQRVKLSTIWHEILFRTSTRGHHSIQSRRRLTDAFGVMRHLTARTRRSRTKFPPQYARSASFDDLPSGGRLGAAEVEAGRSVVAEVMRGVIVGGLIKPRMCRLVKSGRAVAN